MAFGVGIKLRGDETAADVTFQLRQVDPISGEPAERLVERRRYVAHTEHETGHYVFRFRSRIPGFRGHDDEAGGVVFGVLDIGFKGLEPVHLGRQLGRDSGLGFVASRRHVGRRACGVHVFDRFQAQLADQVAALVECVNVAVHVGQVADPGPRQAKQVMVHALEMLGDDVKVRFR